MQMQGEQGQGRKRGLPLLEAPFACFWPAVIGLAIEGCAGQYRALEAVAGIRVFFSWELTAARTLSLVLIICVIALARQNHGSFVFKSRYWGDITAALFSLGLAAFFSSRLFVTTNPLATAIGDMVVPAVALLYLFIWFDRLFAFGLKSALLTIAASLVARSFLQVFLLLLQPTPSMFAIALFPLLSLPFFHALRAGTQNLQQREDGTDDGGSAVAQFPRMVTEHSTIAFIALLALVLLVNLVTSLLNSQIQFMSAEGTNAMPNRQSLEIAANFLAGLVLLFFARTPFGRLQLVGFLLFLIFIAEAALYSFASLAGTQLALPILLTACATRMLDFVVVFPAFIFSEPGQCDFSKHAIARAMCTISNLALGMFILGTQDFETLANIQIASFVGLAIAFILFAACVVDKHNLDTSFVAQNPTTAEEESPRHAYFREALDALAQEYKLTTTEVSVLRLVAQGMNAESVSKELVVSVNTAKTHIRNIYSKTGVHSQQELIALAHKKKDELRSSKPARS